MLQRYDTDQSLSVTADDFERRWDVNGDGEIDVLELPRWVIAFIERRNNAR